MPLCLELSLYVISRISLSGLISAITWGVYARLTDPGPVTVEDLENCSLEHFPRLLVYVETVAVVRPEYRGQTQLQGPSISVDGEKVGQGEVSLLGGDISRFFRAAIMGPFSAWKPTIDFDC